MLNPTSTAPGLLARPSVATSQPETDGVKHQPEPPCQASSGTRHGTTRGPVKSFSTYIVERQGDCSVESRRRVAGASNARSPARTKRKTAGRADTTLMVCCLLYTS